MIVIRKLTAQSAPDTLAGLSKLFVDCVSDGAAIGMIHPFTDEDSAVFWETKVFPDLAREGRYLFAAEHNGEVVGTVQLITDMPPNQPHRAEIAKMMVSPNMRRQGIGRLLMDAAIEEARVIGKTTLTLDTRSNDVAEPLYRSVGFEVAGEIPNFALDPDGTTLHATTYMHMNL